MNENIIQVIAQEINQKPQRVKAVIELLEDGNTVPFIARYRKEATGSLDEVQIKDIEDLYHYQNQLHARKEEVTRLIEEQGKLTPELVVEINAATKLQRVEDLYRPFKQKRRTKATIAKEKGLLPFANRILDFTEASMEDLYHQTVEDNTTTLEEALEGARDIIAEMISDDAKIREEVRMLGRKKGFITTKDKDKAKDEKQIFEMYYDYDEPIRQIVPHRILAINRGEKEEILKVTITIPYEQVLSIMWRNTLPVTGGKYSVPQVKLAIEDAYKRLIFPSIERELRNELTETAEEQAIHIFSENLRSLLLQPPLQNKMVLGVDPAFRTGCKLAVVNELGQLLMTDVIYPHPPKPKKEAATSMIQQILAQYPIEVIAIGNGTASRETEQFIADTIQDLKHHVSYVIVNEAGASVYSASPVAREEFPNLQVEERSAVSIARRLQDPLSELVKIEPKAVGVGQYQHDVSQKKLTESLTFIVETAVNQVGVDVNTASASLLQYVSGLSKTVAENIVKQRDESGRYISRASLKKVPRLGAKTYEQAIGFLRVPKAKNPLDATGIHPESYAVAESILQEVGLTKAAIGSSQLTVLRDLDLEAMSEKLGIGVITLRDIINILQQPMRDPRDQFPQPMLKTTILQIKDLQTGMKLEGTVRNVVDFGAFIDIGLKQDGLVHISKMKKMRVKHPLDVVTVGDIVTVWVESIDLNKGRVALTMLEQ